MSTANQEQRFPTAGALAGNRIVKMDSDGNLALASDSDANAIGATLCGVSSAGSYDTGPPVRLKGGGPVEVKIAPGETITRGNVAYQADNGMLAAAGTVVAGVALTGGTAGQLVELLM